MNNDTPVQLSELKRFQIEENISQIAQLCNNLFEAVYIVNTDSEIVYVSNQLEKKLGFNSDEILGKRCCQNIFSRFCVSEDDSCTRSCPVHQVLSKKIMIETDAVLFNKKGNNHPFQIRIVPLTKPDGQISNAAIILKDRLPDIRARQYVGALKKLASLDHLTELPNRRNVEISLEKRFEERQRYGWTFGVLFIDIDHFKRINDKYGHDMGDETLKKVAKIFQKQQRPFDVLGRWGGEEFVIIVSNITAKQLALVAERFRRSVAEFPFQVNHHSIQLTISIGGAIVQPGDTPGLLVQRADELMYKSKQKGRNRVTIE